MSDDKGENATQQDWMEKAAAFQMMPFPGVSGNNAGLMGSVYGQTETPSQFFTIAGQFLPRDLNGLVKWAYFLVNLEPLISEVIRKLAAYPITDFIPDTADASLKRKYKDLTYHMDLKSKLISIGFDYYLLGNVFISLYFPFQRMLDCPNCGSSYALSHSHDFFKFENYQFQGSCSKCGYNGVFKHHDVKVNNEEQVNLVVFDPRDITVNYNPISGQSEYWYDVPSYIRTKIAAGDVFFLSTIPWSMVEAVRDSKQYLFYKDSIYHLKMPGVTNALPGLGVPPIVGMWETVFNKAAARRANSAIAMEMLMPMRIVYPDISGTADPSTRFSLQAFARNMRTYMARHKTDPLAAVFSPIPVGYQEITGNGKALLITQEIEQMEDYLLLSLGVSREMISGTLNWTSSTVGLRLLANTLYRYTDQIQRLMDWIFRKVCPELNMEVVPVTLEPFQLTDNDSEIANLLQLAGNNMVSQETALSAMGLDADEEQRRMREEQIEAAKQQVVVEYEKQRAVWSQTRDQFSGGPDDYKSALEKAGDIANQFLALEEGPRRSALMRLKVENPAQYLLVSKLIEEYRDNPNYKEQVSQDGAQAAQEASQSSPPDGQDQQAQPQPGAPN